MNQRRRIIAGSCLAALVIGGLGWGVVLSRSVESAEELEAKNREQEAQLAREKARLEKELAELDRLQDVRMRELKRMTREMERKYINDLPGSPPPVKIDVLDD